MPIKWRPFNLPTPKGNFPFDNLDLNEESGWIPFIPGSGGQEPAVDIYQDKNNLYIELSLEGVRPEDVEVSLEDNVLTVQGKIEEEKKIGEKDYIRKERKTGSFRRVIKLPVEVKENQAKAEAERGILKISVPKVDKKTSKAKNVPIEIK